MTVKKSLTRKAVLIEWATDLVEGDTVTGRAVNPNNLEDLSDFEGKNSGEHVVTYPTDYEGASEITITGSDGGEDTGEITV